MNGEIITLWCQRFTEFFQRQHVQDLLQIFSLRSHNTHRQRTHT